MFVFHPILEKEHIEMGTPKKITLSRLEIFVCCFIGLYGLVNTVVSIKVGATWPLLGNILLLASVGFYLWTTFNKPALPILATPAVGWAGIGLIAYSKFGVLESILFFLLAILATLEWSRKRKEVNETKGDTEG
jgi:hypothetical protein